MPSYVFTIPGTDYLGVFSSVVDDLTQTALPPDMYEYWINEFGRKAGTAKVDRALEDARLDVPNDGHPYFRFRQFLQDLVLMNDKEHAYKRIKEDLPMPDELKREWLNWVGRMYTVEYFDERLFVEGGSISVPVDFPDWTPPQLALAPHIEPFETIEHYCQRTHVRLVSRVEIERLVALDGGTIIEDTGAALVVQKNHHQRVSDIIAETLGDEPG